MSFCRITGRSRGLPKPNYFPLLPPISPADAKRFCRITGKSYGLPTHHYIPVVLGFHSSDKNKKCKITTKSSGLGPHHYSAGIALGEKKKHVVLKDFRYIFPILDGDSEHQVALRNLLESKEPLEEEKDLKFVYTVQERRCSLVFPAQLEAAVRDGDVRDVMLSKDCDTVLLRLKQGKNLSVEFKDFDEYDELYDGCGPREDIFRERQTLEAESKKRKKKRQDGLSYAKKIFEDKEKAAEEEETKIAKQVKLRSLREEKQKKQLLNWKQIGRKQSKNCIVADSCKLKKAKKILNHSLDESIFNAIQENSTVEYTPIVNELPTPFTIEPETIDLQKTPLGAYSTPVSAETGGFETITVVEPFLPLTAQPEAFLQEAVKNINIDDLKDTSDVCAKFLAAGKEALDVLSKINEIPKLVECMNSGERAKMHNVKGLKLDIESAQKFIAGQYVQTPQGDVFVPGQTLETENGETFVPGFTVHTADGPLLIPGQIISIKEENGKLTPVFVAGQTLPTNNGNDFVQGQTIHTSEGPKFVVGQTVLTKEGPKFVPGQVIDRNKFVPGQVVTTREGAQFMPGQTITDHLGQQTFVPGQSYQVNGNWEFMPGQTVKMEDGSQQFVPGQSMMLTNGLQFVPGQNVVAESGESHFVPGITKVFGKEKRFVPGMTLETPQGPNFVEGQIVQTADGDKFMPGTTEFDESGFKFAVAESLDKVNLSKPAPYGMPIDPTTTSAFADIKKEIFGHIIQTETGVEFIAESSKKFYRGKKMIPGQLVKNKEGHRFVPGIMTDDGFLPGQIVSTEAGEKFVPGQVIDTSSGPKFVPGQMVETRSGAKFVPGQTVDTPDGPQFIPGQIVETKVGPTFIPGQVISTEDEGSRFVPGQVVNTPDGPRFVPGRVVESAEHGVIFIPGQIVQTEEGPRFVAPDLIDTPEGEMEFSVQGFEVTPEELKLLRPRNFQYHSTNADYSEATIDSDMLKQLSDAGLSVGKKVSMVIPSVDIDVDPIAVDLDHALVIAEKLGLRGNIAVKMAQVVSTIATLADKIVHQHFENTSFKACVYQNGHASNLESITCQKLTNGNSHEEQGNDSNENEIQNTLRSALTAAVLAFMDENVVDNKEVNGDIQENGKIENLESKRDYVFSAISETLSMIFNGDSRISENSIEKCLQTLLVPQKRNSICTSAITEVLDSSDNKVDILKSTLVAHALKSEAVVDRLSQVLEEEKDIIGSAFKLVTRNNPELISLVLQKVSQDVSIVDTEKQAAETVHKAIVKAVQEYSEACLDELLQDKGSAPVRELLLQAVGLARALGMCDTASSLLSVISDEKSTAALANDKIALDVLKRLTIMRNLSEERPLLMSALGELLSSNVEKARNNPNLRTLVRESAALMVVPEEALLESSSEIPTSLLCNDNSLAMEDYIARRGRKSSAAIMILKQGLQAVVPREAARSVLTGQVAYTLLDEQGIQHFEPLHVFSALRLSKPAAHRFSMYCCPVAKTIDDDGEVESDIFSMQNGHNASANSTSSLENSIISDRYKKSDLNGLDLSKWDKDSEYASVSRENTPSFCRISSLYEDNNKLVNVIHLKPC